MEFYRHLAQVVRILCFIYFMGFGSCNTLPTDWKSRIHSSVWDSPITNANWSSRSDIIVDESQSGFRAGVAQNGHMSPFNYWPNNGKCIPFKLHHAFDGDANARRMILHAMRTIESRTDSCINFKMWSNEPEYIFIKPGRHCEADVGRTPGMITTVRLAKECMTEGIILHEMMHALGFFHEHSRPDRDDYLDIFPDRVESGQYDRNFIILMNMSNHGLQYDFESIMHYAPWAFAQNWNRPTMVPKVRFPVKMGHQQYLSALDVAKLKRAYGWINERNEPLPDTALSTCTVDSYLKAPVLTTTKLSSTKPPITDALPSENSAESRKSALSLSLLNDMSPSDNLVDYIASRVGRDRQATICGVSCSVITAREFCIGYLRWTSKVHIRCPRSDVKKDCRKRADAARDAVQGTVDNLRAQGNRQGECA